MFCRVIVANILWSTYEAFLQPLVGCGIATIASLRTGAGYSWTGTEIMMSLIQILNFGVQKIMRRDSRLVLDYDMYESNECNTRHIVL